MKKIIGLVLIAALILSFHAGLIKATSASAQTFDLKAKYTYIRSCPKGGGIFIVYIEPYEWFNGKVLLDLIAPPFLSAKLDKKVLDWESPLAEITISPHKNVPIGTHYINLVAYNIAEKYVETVQTIQLEVEIFEWEADVSQNLEEKKDLFVEWLEQEHPEFEIYSKQKYDSYNTYPEILIVEHGTFLNSEWEMRVCDHVMIPPYDWSMLYLRKRGTLEPLFAAKRETDNTIHEIPVSDYPILLGY